MDAPAHVQRARTAAAAFCIKSAASFTSWCGMRRLNSIVRGCRRFRHLASGRRALVVEAALYLLLARLTLIVVPFPKLARRVGGCVRPADSRATQARLDTQPEQSHTALEVGWAVTRAARHFPFKVLCLPQAMSARAMLAQRGVSSVLHFGTAGGQQAPLIAHVWLDAAGIEVTGYPVGAEFTEIACFV
jgi:Transglutaminase-like superfamily